MKAYAESRRVLQNREILAGCGMSAFEPVLEDSNSGWSQTLGAGYGGPSQREDPHKAHGSERSTRGRCMAASMSFLWVSL